MGFATKAIHVGQEPDPATGAIIVPIYQTSTYVQEALGKHKGYEYARTQNPTRSALEKNLAALEGGVGGIAFGSGMAAINAVFSLLKAGDHIIVSFPVYGGVYRLLRQVLCRFGLEADFVDTSSMEAIRKAARPQTQMLYVETPTNPVMTLTDLEASSEIAKQNGWMLVVDNTFMSPYLQRPFEFGAELIVHSTTKFLNGHSDSVGGAVIANSAELVERLRFLQNAAGAILSPFDAWLVLRGVKTLALRMDQHNKNGMAVADHLIKHPKVKKVNYPGLASHPQHRLARRQMKGFGAMISFDLGSLEAARQVLNHVRLCSLAESLGGVETLISHPATMTHASMPAEDRQRIGITDGLVRISVGIEDVEDIIADLDQALKYV
ncbi:MAG TPA: PLP-dependent aspartate aminotransferase family protein [Candidatus Acidoferrales bacterium]